MRNFWKKTNFWDKVRNSLAIFGTPGGAIAAYVDANPFWLAVSVVSAIAIGLIAVWMVDNDKNGFVDIFEDK